MIRWLGNQGPWAWLASVLGASFLGWLAERILDQSRLIPWAVILTLVVFAVSRFLKWRDDRSVRVTSNIGEFQTEKTRLQALRNQFSLFRATEDLRPRDFGFQYLEPGDEYDLHLRPHYSRYINRRFKNLAESSPATFPTTDESQVRENLLNGQGVVLVGPPVDGKSRTLYELVSELPNWIAVRPFRDREMPTDEAFELLKGKSVAIVVDDLNAFADSRLDLATFAETMNRFADRVTVIATVRDGPELSVIRNARSTGAQRFFESLPHKLRLQPTSIDDRRHLVEFVGLQWSDSGDEIYPTPGSITMATPMEAMRERFETLPYALQDVLRSCQLLNAGGLPITRQRLESALTHVFNRSSLHLSDSLSALGEYAFIKQPSTAGPMSVELAYVNNESVVSYSDGKVPPDDFEQLSLGLLSSEDAEGLAYLASTAHFVHHNPELAHSCLEKARTIAPQDESILHNYASSLANVGNHTQAEIVLRQIIEDFPEDSGAHLTLSRLLFHIFNREAEALEEVEKALELDTWDIDAARDAFASNGDEANFEISRMRRLGEVMPSRFHIHVLRSQILTHFERYEEALVDIDSAIYIVPVSGRAIAEKSKIFLRMERWQEAIATSDDALNVWPNLAEALSYKAYALWQLAKFSDSIQLYRHIQSLEPLEADHILNEAEVLMDMQAYEPALQAYDRALSLADDSFKAQVGRGRSLFKLSQYEDSAIAWQFAISREPDDVYALNGLVDSLRELDRLPDAVQFFDREIGKRVRDVGLLISKGNLMAEIGNHDEALKTYDEALEIDPECETAQYNRLFQIYEMHKSAEEILTAANQVALTSLADASVFALRGQMLFILGQTDESLESLDVALELDPQEVMAIAAMAIIYANLSEEIGAVEEAKKWLCQSWYRRSELIPAFVDELLWHFKRIGQEPSICD